jgi:hypothetical protein
MASKLLMIHGRGQASDAMTAAHPELLNEFIAQKKRQFVAGLAKGLVLSRMEQIPESDMIFPFYGNKFADLIADFERGGGAVPNLEIAGAEADTDANNIADVQAEMLGDMAAALGYDSRTELGYLGHTPPAVEEEGIVDRLLSIPFIAGALQFVSRKTGVPNDIIEQHLSDVAYYIGNDDMRQAVLGIVRKALNDATNPGDSVVVLGHSLGSVVAYDLLAQRDDVVKQLNVSLFVTAGCPLGLKVVKKRVIGFSGDGLPRVPAVVPNRAGGWLNAFDPKDIVALIHPLAPEFAPSGPGQIVDEQTNNPSGPHAIIDYLADPDVAAPIARAMRLTP